MVFALETYCPASDGQSAARIEEEVLVTSDGCEILTTFPADELLVAGASTSAAPTSPSSRGARPSRPTSPMHHVGTLSRTQIQNGGYAGRSEGLSRRLLVGGAEGSPHQAVSIAELAPGGHVDARISRLRGGVLRPRAARSSSTWPAASRTLSADDYVFVDEGRSAFARERRCRDGSLVRARAPRPGSAMIEDTVFVPGDVSIDLPDVAFRRGHFDETQLPQPSENLGLAGFGAANVGGAAVKIIVGREIGASQFILMVVQYAPGGFISLHDHAFEEAFFFLEGEIEAELDGETHTLRRRRLLLERGRASSTP